MVEWKNVRYGKRHGVWGRDILGYVRTSKSNPWSKSVGNESLMKIRESLDNPKTFSEIWKILKRRTGLREFDWSWIRDEEDPKVIKRYLRIAEKYQKGKPYSWERSKKNLTRIV